MSSPSETSYSKSANPKPNSETIDFIERLRVNQERLAKELRPSYDFIVCGSGSSGSVVACRLAENREVSVLLLEASGRDDVPSVIEANLWPLNSRVSGTGLSRAVTASTSTGRSMPLPIVIIGERLERSGRWLTE